MGQAPARGTQGSQENIEKEHSLKKLWKVLEKRCPRCDSWASDEQKRGFRDLLFELDAQDPNSQAGRYPHDVRHDPTLAGLAATNVDLGLFKHNIRKMHGYLGCVKKQMQDGGWDAA